MSSNSTVWIHLLRLFKFIPTFFVIKTYISYMIIIDIYTIRPCYTLIYPLRLHTILHRCNVNTLCVGIIWTTVWENGSPLYLWGVKLPVICGLIPGSYDIIWSHVVWSPCLLLSFLIDLKTYFVRQLRLVASTNAHSRKRGILNTLANSLGRYTLSINRFISFLGACQNLLYQYRKNLHQQWSQNLGSPIAPLSYPE